MAKKKLSKTAKLAPTDLELAEYGGNSATEQNKYGDIMWIKIGKSSVWPGQVVDIEKVNFKPKNKAKDAQVLVRVYGSYEYLHVDPLKNSLQIENFLRQEDLSFREAFEYTLEEDLSHLRSGSKAKRVPVNNDEASKSRKRKRDCSKALSLAIRTQPTRTSERIKEMAPKLEKVTNEKNSNQLKPKTTKKGKAKDENVKEPGGTTAPVTTAKNKRAKDENVSKKAKDDNSKQSKEKAKDDNVKKSTGTTTPVTTAKNKKAKDENVKEPTGTETPATITPGKSGNDVRRLKVMQNLGLIAPAGSPFLRKGVVLNASLE